MLAFKWLCFIATLSCAIWCVAAYTYVPLLVCLIVIGVLKYGSYNIDTSWYDTDYFTVDGKIYEVYDDNRNAFITILFFVLVVGFQLALGWLYISEYIYVQGMTVGGKEVRATAWLAFIPAIWHGIGAVLKTLMRIIHGE